MGANCSKRVIENIGVKTTRIRSLSGEQVVLSNSDLLNSRIHNFKHFKERRGVFRLGAIYQTPRDLLEQIPGMLRAAVDDAPLVWLPRSRVGASAGAPRPYRRAGRGAPARHSHAGAWEREDGRPPDCDGRNDDQGRSGRDPWGPLCGPTASPLARWPG